MATLGVFNSRTAQAEAGNQFLVLMEFLQNFACAKVFSDAVGSFNVRPVGPLTCTHCNNNNNNNNNKQ